MKPLRRIVGLLAVVVILHGCTNAIDSGGSANTPTEMFEYLIEKPLPARVQNLEGGGDTWQGYSIYLRFTPDSGFRSRLVAAGFRETKWEQIRFRFALPNDLGAKFSTPWAPDSIKRKKCFEKDVTNPWTHAGTHYFVLDEENGIVYFYGVGA